MIDGTEHFLPYHEPSLRTILIQSSFILCLNFISTVLDNVIFCGLLGQVFIGIAWGTPGANWLDTSSQKVMVQLGYLGLLLLVFEGGLGTKFQSLKANISLSMTVAVTGICCPMGLAFVLQPLAEAVPLQSFAAGAALCSTSLGTTFTVLNSSGLLSTRLGTVLSSAAMIDDVIGLVMIQVVSNLGQEKTSLNPVTVIRPLAVSFGLAITVPVVCRLIVKPITLQLNQTRHKAPSGYTNKFCTMAHTAPIIHTLILFGLVTGATFAGTSNLFAAYLAGAAISWWDSELPHPEITSTPTASQASSMISSPHVPLDNRGLDTYHQYYAPVTAYILKPFFFASIGFAIPIADMFHGEVLWKGVVFSVLMFFAKLITGVWLIRCNIWPGFRMPKGVRSIIMTSASCFRRASRGHSHKKQAAVGNCKRTTQLRSGAADDIAVQDRRSVHQVPNQNSRSSPSSQISNPLSLYPAAMLGTAMVSRGEIGFLIASLAETSGLLRSQGEEHAGSSKLYLIVTWANVLCTIIGPLSVGMLTRRVRKLQGRREGNPGGIDPLGHWGI
ncbi:hypothetical protein MGYG_01499 [Nannizzia gypsea CBS 118893]|uniref:Cation/H+ exchanger transmembrane domain-containing protein n=1 Tax=Arthroderma gypseum (strain ATCC MYA-4604 / CBS 118893) TaxID=535722 RepID=E5R182_ARTGP|nr:hypothetical protein MGYG_01499 [Nannizzia gypsea CBS 118893]EFQ98471.1 hypothetical protein MGYG_01499 [Nannizzia gypsea CBS 118893]